jgi:hypothetical protein
MLLPAAIVHIATDASSCGDATIHALLLLDVSYTSYYQSALLLHELLLLRSICLNLKPLHYIAFLR